MSGLVIETVTKARASLLAITLLTPHAASAMPHRHLGLWRQTTEAKVTFDPKLTPEERSFVIKPGSALDGAKTSVDICVTEDVNAFAEKMQKGLLKIGKTCSIETHETASTSTTELKCSKTGTEGSIRTAWTGNTRFETTNHTKSFTEGRHVEGTIRTVSEYVRDDCGSVKPTYFPLPNLTRPQTPDPPPETPEVKRPLEVKRPPVAPGSDPLRPIMRTHILPPYPRESVAAHEEGTTVVEAHITVEGAVDDCKVLQSSGYSRLDRATCDFIIANWRWQPPTNQGKPFAVNTKISNHWDLRNAK